MISFLNDYNELAHPKILEDMIRIQKEPNVGYGQDQHCQRASDYIKKALGDEKIDVHFIHGGTAANIVAIQAGLRSFDGVISCDSGHIVGHENGAIEALGHQIIQVPNKAGKLDIGLLKEVLEDHSEEYSVNPAMVYISNVTELGTVYTKRELKEISDFCKANDLYLYMDGARLATALASEYCDYNFGDLLDFFDIFSIGGTKNGFLFGEALVVVNNKLKTGFRKTIKQKGAMLAKGFALGVQFESMFKDGLYFNLGRDAIKAAKNLAHTFIKNGIDLYQRQEANLVFPILKRDLAEFLHDDFLFEKIVDLDKDRTVYRFVARYMTEESDISLLNDRLEEYNARS
ncbi:MAG: aminotransferase class I/II-fold pyridoxal phosphate-dependent enzyme [Tissierellia bacterium]|nr:aminotransferase class I/II-fold pyridoxal phosphate-dependent enzyme [Tissierellia bacterium]